MRAQALPASRRRNKEDCDLNVKAFAAKRLRSAAAARRSAATPHDHSVSVLNLIFAALEDAKAEDVVSIDLQGRTPIGDFMVIASGRSNRHVGAIADQLLKKLKEAGEGAAKVEGLPQCDWVLIDTGDVIVHIFRPEVREFYNLEKMWSGERPTSLETI